MKTVFVVGVGMTNFVKAGTGKDYPELGKEAVERALKDARIKYDDIQQAVCGYNYGESTSGQRVLYQVGMTGIPIYNINNSGSTGASALYLAKQLVEGGVCDTILVVGFEKMSRQPVGFSYHDRTYPTDRHMKKIAELFEVIDAPITAQLFGNAGMEHMKKYGTTTKHFAKIAVKNHKHSVKNPYAQSRREYSLEEVLNSRNICGPLTILQCCPTSDGASAVVLMSEKAVISHGLQDKAVEVLGMEMATDTCEIFTGNSVMKLAGYDMTVLAAKKLYKSTGISPNDINIVELHDCFSCNELITYEGLQLCKEGEGGKFVDAGDNTYGGRVVVNPSGGSIGRGHPIGASGLAQTTELVWQLRGEAGERQVPDPKLALQHSLGIGGSVVVGLYRKGFKNPGQNMKKHITNYPEEFQASAYIKILEATLQKLDDSQIESVRGTFGVRIRDGPYRTEGYWIIDVNKRRVTLDGTDIPNVTFTVSADDFSDFVTGKIDLETAQRIKQIDVQGEWGYAKKFLDLLRIVRSNSEAMRSKL